MNEVDNRFVLLVEDSPEDAELTERNLIRRSNIPNKVIIVRSGEEALDFLFCTGLHVDRDRNDMPAVIILDLGLPTMHGFDLLKCIRENDDTKHIPVVVFTGTQEESVIRLGYKLGVTSYVCKPSDPMKFTNVVRLIGLYWVLVNEPMPSSIMNGEDDPRSNIK